MDQGADSKAKAVTFLSWDDRIQNLEALKELEVSEQSFEEEETTQERKKKSKLVSLPRKLLDSLLNLENHVHRVEIQVVGQRVAESSELKSSWVHPEMGIVQVSTNRSGESAKILQNIQ